MNLKKFIWPLLLLPLLSCNEKVYLDQALVESIWQEAIRLTGISSENKVPKVIFLQKDYYGELEKLNCDLSKKKKKYKCNEKQEHVWNELEKEVGLSYESLKSIYLDHLPSEWKLQNEDCSKYNQDKKTQCLKDKVRILEFAGGNRGRIFFTEEIVEIYQGNLERSFLENHILMANRWMGKEKWTFVYCTVGHELLHMTLYIKDVDINKHHKVMKDEKMMEKMMDFLDKRIGSEMTERQKNSHLGSLDAGIELDDLEKRINQRIGESQE